MSMKKNRYLAVKMHEAWWKDAGLAVYEVGWPTQREAEGFAAGANRLIAGRPGQFIGGFTENWRSVKLSSGAPWVAWVVVDRGLNYAEPEEPTHNDWGEICP